MTGINLNKSVLVENYPIKIAKGSIIETKTDGIFSKKVNVEILGEIKSCRIEEFAQYFWVKLNGKLDILSLDFENSDTTTHHDVCLDEIVGSMKQVNAAASRFGVNPIRF